MDQTDRGVAQSDLTLEQVLERAWTDLDPDESTPALELDVSLLGASHVDSRVDDESARHLLAKAIETFGGERAFLFRFAPSRHDMPELIGCDLSIDLDGDAVSSPERKVTPELLLEAASSQRPVRRDVSGDGGGTGTAIALPAISRDLCQAVIVVENRFRPLTARRAGIRALALYSRHLAWRIDLANLVRENEDLWRDLGRLQETSAPAPTVIEPTAGRAERRRGLKGDYSMIVGSSPKMLEILQVIDRISSSVAPVLINGESGTGKELVALAVHRNSPRRDKPFVSENCAAITETLLESELFGYVKGAFTGANKDHKGLFEIADGGTLFLDEVGDMSSSMQKKLLRVLQEGVIRRVGAKDYTKVDVRIISATNKDLLSECKAGSFREDLYYRLNVINLLLPPLRQRRDDIPELAQFFLSAYVREMGTEKRIHPSVLQRLAQHGWPGNVRELQNEIKKLCALSEGDTIQVSDLSETLLFGDREAESIGDWPFEIGRMTLKEATETLERELIRKALVESGGNKSVVAKSLQIPKTSLYNKINKYKLG